MREHIAPLRAAAQGRLVGIRLGTGTPKTLALETKLKLYKDTLAIDWLHLDSHGEHSAQSQY